jgi:hypothetical protein
MKGMSHHHARVPLIAAAVVLAGPMFAADPACKFLADANTKIYSVPTHIYMTETAGGKTRTSELIYLNNKTYLQVGGKWQVSPQTPSQMAEIRKETEADAEKTMTCHLVRDEPVNGEAAALYTAHQQNPDEKSDSQLWISKSKGVPLKLEMDMDVGGASGKSHRSMRYEYTNVQAPSGVK